MTIYAYWNDDTSDRYPIDDMGGRYPSGSLFEVIRAWGKVTLEDGEGSKITYVWEEEPDPKVVETRILVAEVLDTLENLTEHLRANDQASVLGAAERRMLSDATSFVNTVFDSLSKQLDGTL
jgi:hypothetical protein